MNKWLSRIIIAVLLIGAFAGIGVVAYRVGYQQAIQAAAKGAAPLSNRAERFNQMPQFHPGFNNPGFSRGPQQGFGYNHFGMMERGRGFGFFPPLYFLFGLILLGLVIWLGYKLFKGNGWQLSMTRQSANSVISEEETKSSKKKAAKSKE
jgi:hypothetical protein